MSSHVLTEGEYDFLQYGMKHRLPTCPKENNILAYVEDIVRSIRFKTQYYVNKIEFYCNTKDKIAVLSNSFVVYDYSCPGCGTNFIGKTERTLHERTVEDAWTDNNSAVYKHLSHCTFNICLILHLCIHHFLRHQHLFKTVTNLI